MGKFGKKNQLNNNNFWLEQTQNLTFCFIVRCVLYDKSQIPFDRVSMNGLGYIGIDHVEHA